MDAETIVTLITSLADLVAKLAPLATQGGAVLNETDAGAVHAALLRAEDATAALRPQVDAALDAAAAKG